MQYAQPLKNGKNKNCAVLALKELKQDTSKWHDSFKKFAAYYMKERPNHNQWKLVEYTDLRAIDLAEFLKEQCKDESLQKWLDTNLISLYKNRRANVTVVPDGRTLEYSPLPVMEVFTRYAPDRFQQMWDELIRDNMAPYGLHIDGKFQTINISEYEGILNVGLEAWKKGALSDKAFCEGVEKVFLMLASDRCCRMTENWVMDLQPKIKQEPSWTATPFAGYMEGVRSEGFYNGLAQAFYMTAGQATPFQKISIILHQFTSPGGHHTERIRYGQMSSFNLLNTRNARPLRTQVVGNSLEAEVECVVPSSPTGLPCLGAVEVTDIYFANKSWYELQEYDVKDVRLGKTSLPFKIYFRLGLAPFGCSGRESLYATDKATLVFLAPAGRSGQKMTVKICFRKTT